MRLSKVLMSLVETVNFADVIGTAPGQLDVLGFPDAH